MNRIHRSAAMTRAYYNDCDPFVAQWLRNLIAAGHIAAGDVDERSIEEVQADDVRGYTQVHFFAGIGGWSYALRLAGWPDDRPAWTGSCPCQPFSIAGKRKGHDDGRHLWPAFRRLIAECRPPVVFGEQVASSLGREWLAVVRADLEELGYAVGAADLCAASVGAPHIRQRLWWVADAKRGPAERHRHEMDGAAREAEGEAQQRERVRDDGRHGGAACVLADATSPGHQRHAAPRQGTDTQRAAAERSRAAGRLADADGRNAGAEWIQRGGEQRQQPRDDRGPDRLAQPDEGELRPERFAAGVAGFWTSADWVPCRDGAARPVEPGTFPLAHGIPARLGRLRAYGNAIVPQVAAAFVDAFVRAQP